MHHGTAIRYRLGDVLPRLISHLYSEEQLTFILNIKWVPFSATFALTVFLSGHDGSNGRRRSGPPRPLSITNVCPISNKEKEKAKLRIVAHHRRSEPFSSASHTVTVRLRYGRRWTVPMSTLNTSRSFSFVRTLFIGASFSLMTPNSYHRYLRILSRRYRPSKG